MSIEKIILYEVDNNDDGDDVDYDDESDGVQEYLKELDDILGNEIDGDDGEDDIGYNDINWFDSIEDDRYVEAGGDINNDNTRDESD